jgi:hypothetical protein
MYIQKSPFISKLDAASTTVSDVDKTQLTELIKDDKDDILFKLKETADKLSALSTKCEEKGQNDYADTFKSYAEEVQNIHDNLQTELAPVFDEFAQDTGEMGGLGGIV